MSDDAATAVPVGPRRRRPWSGRIVLWLGIVVAAIIVLFAASAVVLDSGAGRRFITDRIERLAPESGLRIRIGRIEGSIYRQAVLRDVRLYDRQGLFFQAAEARLDWRPIDYLLRNRLTIHDLNIPRASLTRLPDLVPSVEDTPLLPDFDIAIDRLRVGRLALAEGVGGRASTATLDGRADIRSGTANVRIAARLIDGGDQVQLSLVAAPERGEFDIDADVVAPRGGVLAGMAGLDRGLSGVVRGQGNWQRWTGALIANSGETPVARLRLTATDGRYGAQGRIRPDLFTTGMAQRLTAGGIALDASGTFADRRIDGRAAVVGTALQIDAEGRIDLAANRFGSVRVNSWVRQPGALLDNFNGQNIRLALLLDGAFTAPRFEYRLTAPWLSFGTTRFTGVDARGAGVAPRAIVNVPVALRVQRITGVGAFAENLIRNLSADGVLVWRGSSITSNLIRVRSAGLNGRVAIIADLASGRYGIGFDGALPGLEIPGLGRVDLITNLNLRPGARGGFQIGGTAAATVRRLDNGFLRTLTGGLPSLRSGVTIGPDGVVRFDGLVVRSPLLNITGGGIRRPDGTFALRGQGVHRTYGPVIVTLDGPIDRPRVELLLARPLDSAGLSNVSLQLRPTAAGFDFVARGGSLLGPFAATGQILLPRGGATVINIAQLTVGGTVARGRLTVVTGGLAGTMIIAGGGLDGTLALSVPGGVQRIEAHLIARDARFAGPPPITIRRGVIDAVLLLDPRGTDLNATFDATGLRRGPLSISRVRGTARLVDGRGSVTAAIAGARGRRFAMQLAADVAPDRIRVRGEGSFAGYPIRITRPAVLRAEAGGWRLEPAEIAYANGRTRLSGFFGEAGIEVDAALDDLPLPAIDIGWPRLGIGGSVSGRLTYRDRGGLPTGEAQLRLRSLTRSGVTLTSQPIDVALNAALSERAVALRALVRSGGAVIGRIQGRVAPLAAGGDLVTRITTAPLIAQLRYSGASDTLWRLTGVETIELSGPVAVAADVRGTLANPNITGTLQTTNARVESVQTGTVLTGVRAVGRFDGSRLQLRNISGNTAGNGTVTGSGDFDLSSANGFGIDLRLQANRALLIERDDLVARVTGPVRIATDANGGLISGNMRLDAGSFRLGQATAAEALPVINIREINAPADRPDARAVSAPWRLDIAVRGDNRFNVTGLGLESDWATDVRIRGDVANFNIVGTANLVRGEYIFSGRRFALESGTIRFQGNTPIDPVLDIVAVDDIAGIDATIRVRGTGLRPEITFSSVPALPEDELLSRILFGSSITDISVAEAAQLTVALASLRGGNGGLDPINAIRRATGLDRLRILPANSEIGSGTSVAAGIYLTRRVYVEVITDGQGYNATRVEYQITRWLALLASISTIGDESLNLRIKRDY